MNDGSNKMMKTKPSTLWTNLPSDLFSHMTTFLPRMEDLYAMSLTCKAWKDNIKNTTSLCIITKHTEDLYGLEAIRIVRTLNCIGPMRDIQTLTMLGFSSSFFTSMCLLIFERFSNVQHLCVSINGDEKCDMDLTMFTLLSKLKTILFTNAVIRIPDNLKSKIQLPSLISLEISKIIGDAQFALPNLKELDLSLTDDECPVLLPKSLKRLSIFCPDFDNDDFNQVLDMTKGNNKHVVENLDYFDTMTCYASDVMSYLARMDPRIKYLKVGSFAWDDGKWTMDIPHMPYLETLHFDMICVQSSIITFRPEMKLKHLVFENVHFDIKENIRSETLNMQFYPKPNQNEITVITMDDIVTNTNLIVFPEDT